ncbi:MAG TPA: rhomboid family intramembrane serine protease, partial [Gemmatimonadaceae bacterium]|nr:rhomboid family intramembrane serine protease [Gemmatimonadaceae bacterium]
MIPLSDELPTVRTPWMTYLILIAMFATWIFVQGAGFDQQALAASVCNLGMVPGELTHLAPINQAVPLGRGVSCVVDNDRINILTPLISMF